MSNVRTIILASAAATLLTGHTLLAQENGEVAALKPLSEQELKDQQRGQELLNKLLTKQPRFALTGTLEQGSAGVFSINGEEMVINSDTRVEGELTIGSAVSAHGFIEGGKKVARVVQVAPRESNAATLPFEAARLGSVGTVLDTSDEKKK